MSVFRGKPLPLGIGIQHCEDTSLVLQQEENSVYRTDRNKFLNVSVYRYKSTLTHDIEQADLIIGHAGAGTILEALKVNVSHCSLLLDYTIIFKCSFQKKLLVVINESLMQNHQWELANELASKQHLLTATPATLLETVRSDWHSIKNEFIFLVIMLHIMLE